MLTKVYITVFLVFDILANNERPFEGTFKHWSCLFHLVCVSKCSEYCIGMLPGDIVLME